MRTVLASMAGTILDVFITRGEEVQVNQVIVMIESMKMEIPIETPYSGIVKEVRVSMGEFVNEGDVLVIFE